MAEGMTTTNSSGMNSAPTANAPRQPITPRLSALPGKVLRRLQRYYRRYFQNRNYVFVHRGPFPPEHREDCHFKRYSTFEQIPSQVRDGFIATGRDQVLACDRRELDEGATMWAVFIGDELASVIFTRQSGAFRRWFVELGENDIVFIRGRTDIRFRGRGLLPSLMRYAMHNCLKEGGSAYLDCRVYNKPSIRAIQKTGFSCIATMKPLSRQDAFGG